MNLTEVEIREGFVTHYDKLVNLSLNLVRDQETAKDVLQDAAIKLLRKEHIVIHTSLYQYMKRMVINISLDHIKSSKKRSETEKIGASIMYVHNESEEPSIKNLLEKGLETLSPKKRIIFTLHRIEGLDPDEIADHLSVSRKTVENQLSMALKELRIFFKGKSHLLWIF